MRLVFLSSLVVTKLLVLSLHYHFSSCLLSHMIFADASCITYFDDQDAQRLVELL